jgi:NADP-reducing hydrogenase subunit HndB
MKTPLEILAEKKAAASDHLKEQGYFSKKRVYVGMATCEIAAGSKEVMAEFEAAKKNGLDIYLSRKGCAGRCHVEPTVEVIDPSTGPVLYTKVDPKKAKEIIREHLIGGEPLAEGEK